MSDVIILNGAMTVSEMQPRIIRSLGPYRVASELQKHGYSVSVIDYIQYMSVEEIINAINKKLTDKTLWVGYSSSLFYAYTLYGDNNLLRMYQDIPYEKVSSIYDYVKKNSNAKIVFGGARALQAQADDMVDYYVAGYADVSSVNLTDFLAGKVESLVNSKQITINNKPSVLIDSGKYPEPSMDSLDTFWYNDNVPLIPGEAVPLEFARGCIFKCKFCSYPLLGKKKGTYIRDMNHIRDEVIKLWETKGVDTFYFTDDTFNDDNDKVEEFHKMFTSLPFKPKFSAFLRLELVDKFPTQADLLLEAGLVGAFFGIETLNHQSGRSIGKGLHPNKTKSRLKWVCDKWAGKVNVGVGFIIGLPYDTMEYFQELRNYVLSDEFPAAAAHFNPLTIYDKSKGSNLYGSEFSLNAEIYGYKFHPQNGWYHEEQNLNFIQCRQISDHLYNLAALKNKISDFDMITYLNTGVKYEDLIKYTQNEILSMYDIKQMNENKLNYYKKQIGAI